MTSTLTSMRRLSIRTGSSTHDLAVPLGTRLGDLLESGGFPTGARLVDASGAALPDDDLVGEAFEDGALLYVVDDVHVPTLTRVAPTGPGRAATSDPRPGPGAPASAPAGGAVIDPARGAAARPVPVDAASAGARTRSAARRTRGRPGSAAPVTTAGPTPAASGPPAPDASGSPASGSPDTDRPSDDRRDGPADPAGADPRDAPGPADGDVTGGRRAAVVPPAVRRTADPAGHGGIAPPPPGPLRSPVPPPPGGVARRAAHAARPAVGSSDIRPAGRDGSEVPRRGPTAVALPAPPRVVPPPSGAAGRATVAVRSGHRAAATAHDRRPAPRGGPAEVALSPGAYAVPMVLAPAAVVLVLISALGSGLPTWSACTAGGALLLGALVACVRAGDTSLRRWGRVAAALAGGCGGFVLGTGLDLRPDVAAVCGLVVGTAVAMLGRTSAIRQGFFEPWITVSAVTTAAVAVDATLAVTLSWPAYVAPLLLAGVSPLVMRALPAVSLEVPQEQLIDIERLSNTSWSARTGVRRKRRPLRQATVELITRRASGVVAAGTVVIGLFVTIGYGIAVLSTMPGSVARWALLVEGVLLLGGPGLASRTVRAPFGKRVLRATAAVVTLETGYYVLRQTGDTADVVVVAALTLLALAVVGGSLALDVGWRSLRLSRIADAAEGFCVVFALPAALLAVDVIAVLRQAAS